MNNLDTGGSAVAASCADYGRPTDRTSSGATTFTNAAQPSLRLYRPAFGCNFEEGSTSSDETESMKLRERYKAGWSSERYSRRAWIIFTLIFFAYFAVGLGLVLSRLNIWAEIFGALLAVVSVAPAVACARRAHNVRQ